MEATSKGSKAKGETKQSYLLISEHPASKWSVAKGWTCARPRRPLSWAQRFINPTSAGSPCAGLSLAQFECACDSWRWQVTWHPLTTPRHICFWCEPHHCSCTSFNHFGVLASELDVLGSAGTRWRPVAKFSAPLTDRRTSPRPGLQTLAPSFTRFCQHAAAGERCLFFWPLGRP